MLKSFHPLPPPWKVKREMRRVYDQFLHAALDFKEIRGRKLHDLWFERHANPTQGEFPLDRKIAIVIIYQPNKVASSLLMTCDHLINQGYSPFVVSNLPLLDDDRSALLARSALLMERPNFGYDFGAYQDGLRVLRRLDCKPDRLILMNDSTWFPLRENDTTIMRLEASGDAFTGQVEKIEQDMRHRKRIDHIESHLLMFKKDALEDDHFPEFWNKYQASSDRMNTILRGEKKLSDTMFKAGFRSEGLISRQQFFNRISLLPHMELFALLKETYGVQLDMVGPLSALVETAQDTPEWRIDALRQLKSTIFTHNFLLSTAFVFASMKYLGLGFVKKGNEKIFHMTRKKVLLLESEGKIAPLDPRVRDEMAASVANWLPSR